MMQIIVYSHHNFTPLSFFASHPFYDGNGRTGRMLMVLQLVHEGILKYPILYISGHIIHHKSLYYSGLRQISEKGNWVEFVLFMLEGFYLQAKNTKTTLFTIMEYREEFTKKFRADMPAIFNAGVVDLLFSQPIVSAISFGEKMGIHRVTASRNLQAMVAKDLLIIRQEGRNTF